MNDVAYWIDPQGTAHNIGHLEHRRWIARRGMNGDEAEDAGWHRVRFVPGQPCETYGRVALTEAQRAAIADIMLRHGAPHHIECTVIPGA